MRVRQLKRLLGRCGSEMTTAGCTSSSSPSPLSCVFFSRMAGVRRVRCGTMLSLISCPSPCSSLVHGQTGPPRRAPAIETSFSFLFLLFRLLFPTLLFLQKRFACKGSAFSAHERIFAPLFPFFVSLSPSVPFCVFWLQGSSETV